MIIHTVAIGNTVEAYVESRFSDGVNIISSDDNNKGKTILIQALMYCLGNKPAFPSSFSYRDYYVIVEFSVSGSRYLLARKDDTFILKHSGSLFVFGNISEFKRYWTKNIFELPTILKDGTPRIVDPELFVQLFFVGQDKKDTANIANRGFYNKDDFLTMLFSLKGFGVQATSPEEIYATKQKIKELQHERSVLVKAHRILKSKSKAAKYLSSVSDRSAFELRLKQVNKKKDEITRYRTARNTAISRKVKCEITLQELRSLNRTISGGELICMDCGSSHIGYSVDLNSPCTFDVSTPEVRSQIISSISEKIASYQEDVDRLTNELNQAQKQFQLLLNDEDISLESLVALRRDILDASEAESRINEIDSEIQHLKGVIQTSDVDEKTQAQGRQELLTQISSLMNAFYRKIDPSGNLIFPGLFSSSDKIYSGSEATIYHLVKLLTLAELLKHNYPIVVDSFRAEDLSTAKERIILNLFATLKLQVIFTTTLKDEELGKYSQEPTVNHIDFAPHSPSKLLTPDYVATFSTLAHELSINL